MILINDSLIREQILEHITELKILQEKEKEDILYCCLRWTTILENNLLIKNFLLHPIVLKRKKFYDDYELISNNELIDLITQVLNYEFSSELKDCFLNSKEVELLINIRKGLQEKKSNNQ